MNWLSEKLHAWLVPPLKAIFGPLDEWLISLSPTTARACAVGLFLLAAVWVWTLRREFVYRGAPSRARWRDLRIWAVLALIPYVIIYATL